MRLRFLQRVDIFWDQVRAGMWMLPLVMMVAGIGLFRMALWVDSLRPDASLLLRWWLFSGSGDDARNLLSTLVAAMITMASLVFSMNVVALSLAASQFGSRLVRSYQRDARTKVTLGLFAMTILYCMLGLRAVGTETPASQVPHVTVTGGLVLSVACVFAMLLFLHMVTQSIVADEVVRRAAADLEESIAGLSPLVPESPELRHQPAEVPPLPADAWPVQAAREGYVEAIRYDDLVGHAEAEDAFVQLHVMAGDFVALGDVIGRYARARGRSTALEQALRQTVLIGPERTPVQDLAYTLRRLVDVALRALSPALNDANTALVVIDRLRGAFSRMLRKQLPGGRHTDGAGVLRLAGPRPTHEDHIHQTLHGIRVAASSQPVVVIKMIEAMGMLIAHAPDGSLRDFLLQQAELAARAGLAENEEPFERAAIERALALAHRAHAACQGGG